MKKVGRDSPNFRDRILLAGSLVHPDIIHQRVNCSGVWISRPVASRRNVQQEKTGEKRMSEYHFQPGRRSVIESESRRGRRRPRSEWRSLPTQRRKHKNPLLNNPVETSEIKRWQADTAKVLDAAESAFSHAELGPGKRCRQRGKDLSGWPARNLRRATRTGLSPVTQCSLKQRPQQKLS
jgi:hypothetical protein